MKRTKGKFVEIARKICPAVITITAVKDLEKIDEFLHFPISGKDLLTSKKGKPQTKVGGGSGFIVSSRGYVLTSQHVVSDPQAEYAVIIEPTITYPARVVCRDPINDVAILKMEGKNFPSLPMGDSRKIELGEEVLAVGNALGEFHDTISSGIISGISRSITAFADHPHQVAQLKGLIQTDAAINPGNSGGPLVNMEGKAIGINTAVAVNAQNIGFAIPINYAKRDLKEILQYGKVKKPFLGVKYVILTKDLARFHKLPVDHGAVIVRESFGEKAVVKGSSAEKAGLQEYDVILEVNGEKVTERSPLANILQKYEIGDTVSLTVLRNGKTKTMKVLLDEKK